MSALAGEPQERFSDHMHAAAIRYRMRWPHLIVNERLFAQCLAWAQGLPKYRLPPRRRPLAEYARSEEEKGTAPKLRAPWGSAWRLRSIPEQDHNYVINGARLLHAQDGKRGEASDDAMNRACQLYHNDQSFDVSLTSRDQRREAKRQDKNARRELSKAAVSGDLQRIKAAERDMRANWVLVSRRADFYGGDDEGNATGEIAADVETGMLAQVGWSRPPRHAGVRVGAKVDATGCSGIVRTGRGGSRVTPAESRYNLIARAGGGMSLCTH